MSTSQKDTHRNGALQYAWNHIRQGVVKDLTSWHELPQGWNDPANPVANLEAGALYFAHILKRHALLQAAARYNGGSGNWRTNDAQNYQKEFNWKNARYQNLIHCME